MKAGALFHLLKIQSPINTPNEYGETLQTWQDFATVSGSVKPISAREFWRAGQIQADATHGVTIRFLPGVTPSMRILFGSRAFNILSVLNVDELGAELQIICKETIA